MQQKGPRIAPAVGEQTRMTPAKATASIAEILDF
jgi:hypothetical protein